MCESGPCRTASRLIVADPAEVPPDCPNRVHMTGVSEGWLRSHVADPGVTLTWRARQQFSHSYAGARNNELLLAIRGGRLLLLEKHIQPPFRASAVLKARQSYVEPTEPPVPPPAPDEHWIEVQLVDKDGKPVRNEKYWIQLSDGTVKEGYLNAQGKVRLEDIPAGNCRIRFPELRGPIQSP